MTFVVEENEKMDDLISRQAAVELCMKYNGVGWVWSQILDEIEKMPSADVQPVRHGHWLRTGRTNVYGGFEVECSVRNDNVMITNIEYEHYCRNCGARMDERSE